MIFPLFTIDKIKNNINISLIINTFILKLILQERINSDNFEIREK